MRGGTVLQRIFSAFPSGSPGAGLLILRASLGVTLVAHAGACLWGWHNLGSLAWGAGIVAIASGLALVIGYLTPLASVLAGLTIIGTVTRRVDAGVQLQTVPGSNHTGGWATSTRFPALRLGRRLN
jgi:hypothetical protein